MSTGDSVLRFGKHVGKTYDTVRKNEPGYVRWSRRVPEPSGQLLDFVAWCQSADEDEQRTVQANRKRAHGAPDGPGLETSTDDYVASQKEKHGHSGCCWDWLDTGECPRLAACTFKHPVMKLRRLGPGGTVATMSSFVPNWVEAVGRLGFTYDREAGNSTRPELSVEKTEELLCSGAPGAVLRAHLVREGPEQNAKLQSRLDEAADEAEKEEAEKEEADGSG
jgi:hypothetical protein